MLALPRWLALTRRVEMDQGYALWLRWGSVVLQPLPTKAIWSTMLAP